MNTKPAQLKPASPQQIEEFAEEFGNEFAELLMTYGDEDYLTHPFEAFLLAWSSVHGEAVLIEDRFPKLLLARCELNKTVGLSGDPASAMTVYIGTIRGLLREWRDEQPAGRIYGSSVAHWCHQHPATFEDIQEAMRLRSPYLRVEEANWAIRDWRPGGPAHKQANKNLRLTRKEQFIRQRTWSQAARTAARAVFGEFLGGAPYEIGFCRKCDKPFHRGKKDVFCSPECARRHSAIVSRHNATAGQRQDTLEKAAKSLSGVLRRSRGADWRKIIELDSGLRTRIDNRHSRLMGEYISASQTAPGSPKRERLLRAHLSCGTVDPKKRANVQLELENFLIDLGKAKKTWG